MLGRRRPSAFPLVPLLLHFIFPPLFLHPSSGHQLHRCRLLHSSVAQLLDIFPDVVNPGLGTAFFSVQNISFFSVLLKNATFFSVLFCEFLATYETQKNVPFFSRFFPVIFRSFLKN